VVTGQAGREDLRAGQADADVLVEQLTIEDSGIAVRKNTPEIRRRNAALKRSRRRQLRQWSPSGFIERSVMVDGWNRVRVRAEQPEYCVSCCADDREHRRERLALAVEQPRAKSTARESPPAPHSTRWPALWPNGTASTRLAPCSSAQPKPEAQKRLRPRRAVATRRARTRPQVGAGLSAFNSRRVHRLVPARLRSHAPASGPLLRCWRDRGLAAWSDPVVEFGDEPRSLRCQALKAWAQDGEITACQLRCNWSRKHVGIGLAVMYRIRPRFQPFGVLKPAERQGQVTRATKISCSSGARADGWAAGISSVSDT